MDEFNSNIDDISECQVLEEVVGLNYLVDNMIIGVISTPQPSPSHSFYNKTLHPQAAPDQELLTLLRQFHPSAAAAREFVAEFLLRDAIHKCLYNTFFKGEFFFGVESEHHRAYLDRLMAEIVASGEFLLFLLLLLLYFYFLFSFLGRFIHPAVQQWCSMTSEALFRMNDGLESVFYSELTASVSILEHTLESLFPKKKFRFIGLDGRDQVISIGRSARALCYKLQTAVKSCRLVISNAPTTDGPPLNFGTYSLGLDKITGTVHTTLLKAKGISNTDLSSFFE